MPHLFSLRLRHLNVNEYQSDQDVVSRYEHLMVKIVCFSTFECA